MLDLEGGAAVEQRITDRLGQSLVRRNRTLHRVVDTEMDKPIDAEPKEGR